MGRQVRMHVLLVAQFATVRALGGPEVREQFATRILARYSLNAWRMLAGEVHPAPKSTKHPGRAQVVIGGAASGLPVGGCAWGRSRAGYRSPPEWTRCARCGGRLGARRARRERCHAGPSAG